MKEEDPTKPSNATKYNANNKDPKSPISRVAIHISFYSLKEVIKNLPLGTL
jgi:hypothetical protein